MSELTNPTHQDDDDPVKISSGIDAILMLVHDYYRVLENIFYPFYYYCNGFSHNETCSHCSLCLYCTHPIVIVPDLFVDAWCLNTCTWCPSICICHLCDWNRAHGYYCNTFKVPLECFEWRYNNFQLCSTILHSLAKKDYVRIKILQCRVRQSRIRYVKVIVERGVAP